MNNDYAPILPPNVSVERKKSIGLGLSTQTESSMGSAFNHQSNLRSKRRLFASSRITNLDTFLRNERALKPYMYYKVNKLVKPIHNMRSFSSFENSFETWKSHNDDTNKDSAIYKYCRPYLSNSQVIRSDRLLLGNGINYINSIS